MYEAECLLALVLFAYQFVLFLESLRIPSSPIPFFGIPRDCYHFLLEPVGILRAYHVFLDPAQIPKAPIMPLSPPLYRRDTMGFLGIL